MLRSKKLRGPYLPYADNPILTQRDMDPNRPDPIGSAGHAKLIQTQKGDWWATFLAVRPYEGDFYNIGRETFLLPVTWKDGWPIILPRGEKITHVGKVPDLPAQPRPALPMSGNFTYTDDFNGDRLAMQWIGIRTPRQPFYRVTNGALELDSGTPLGDLNGVPAFVGRRQQHAVATMSTTMRFTPEKDGDTAGLAAVQSDRSHIVFGITQVGGKKMIALTSRDNADTDTLVASAPLTATGPVTLTIRANGGKMAFDYEADGKRATLKSDLDATLLSTRKAGGFVGTVVGPYRYTPAS